MSSRNPLLMVVLSIAVLSWQWQAVAVTGALSRVHQPHCHDVMDTIAAVSIQDDCAHHDRAPSSGGKGGTCPAGGGNTCTTCCTSCCAPFAAIPIAWAQPYLLPSAVIPAFDIGITLCPPSLPPGRPPRLLLG